MTHDQLKITVGEAPEGYGKDPYKYKYDVLFIKEPYSPDEIMKGLKCREGVDKAYAGEYVLYFTRLRSRASQSRLTRIIILPVYQYITIRNWNTTTRLLELMENKADLL